MPAEVYNCDEDDVPLGDDDTHLSGLARGLRLARRRVATHPVHAAKYRQCLGNAKQLPHHFARGSLFVDPLDVAELSHREALTEQFGIGRGEAACLVLCQRLHADAVVLTSDDEACQVAEQLGIGYLTLPDMIWNWVRNTRPTLTELDLVVEGLRNANFGLREAYLELLRQHCGP